MSKRDYKKIVLARLKNIQKGLKIAENLDSCNDKLRQRMCIDCAIDEIERTKKTIFEFLVNDECIH